MTRLDLTGAINRALEVAMEADERIVVLGEDVAMMRSGLFARFGPSRVRETPISEAAFLGAGVGAALGGLRPVVEIMFVDFITVALHALSNEAAMIATLSGGRWNAPIVVRAACGGGYGDGGQHEQAGWGTLAGIPGLAVAAPSNPADAAGLTLGAFAQPGPAVLLEHKLLSEFWLDSVAGRRRPGVSLPVPEAGMWGEVADPPESIAWGTAAMRREGSDLLVVSVGVGVHRALEAAEILAGDGIDTAVIDLRTLAPLDRETVTTHAAGRRAVVVVDEDYGAFGLSGEIAAVLAESGIRIPYARVTTPGVLPYARHLESRYLPGTDRIVETARSLLPS